MANSTIGLATTSDGKPIRLVDNGDGTYSIAISTSTVVGGSIGIPTTSDGEPIRIVDVGNGLYVISVST